MTYETYIFETLRFLLNQIPQFSLGIVILNSVVGLVTLAIMVIWHEIGHKVTLSHFLNGESVRIRWGLKSVEVGTIEQINKISLEERQAVFASGVLIGFIPMLIVFFTGIIEHFFQTLIFSAYMIASWSDIKVILSNWFKRKKSG